MKQMDRHCHSSFRLVGNNQPLKAVDKVVAVLWINYGTSLVDVYIYLSIIYLQRKFWFLMLLRLVRRALFVRLIRVSKTNKRLIKLLET